MSNLLESINHIQKVTTPNHHLIDQYFTREPSKKINSHIFLFVEAEREVRIFKVMLNR